MYTRCKLKLKPKIEHASPAAPWIGAHGCEWNSVYFASCLISQRSAAGWCDILSHIATSAPSWFLID